MCVCVCVYVLISSVFSLSSFFVERVSFRPAIEPYVANLCSCLFYLLSLPSGGGGAEIGMRVCVGGCVGGCVFLCVVVVFFLLLCHTPTPSSSHRRRDEEDTTWMY